MRSFDDGMMVARSSASLTMSPESTIGTHCRQPRDGNADEPPQNRSTASVTPISRWPLLISAIVASHEIELAGVARAAGEGAPSLLIAQLGFPPVQVCCLPATIVC